MERRALITGIAGQDGSLLSRALARRRLRGLRDRAGKRVGGRIRTSRTIRPRVQLLPARPARSEHHLISRPARLPPPPRSTTWPLPSFVPLSVGAAGAHGGVRRRRSHCDARGDTPCRRDDPLLHQASTSSRDLRRGRPRLPQTEETPITPATPYSESRRHTGHFITQAYRRQYGIYACSGTSSTT